MYLIRIYHFTYTCTYKYIPYICTNNTLVFFHFLLCEWCILYILHNLRRIMCKRYRKNVYNQLEGGLAQMHGLGYSHCDLSLDNIFVWILSRMEERYFWVTWNTLGRTLRSRQQTLSELTSARKQHSN